MFTTDSPCLFQIPDPYIPLILHLHIYHLIYIISRVSFRSVRFIRVFVVLALVWVNCRVVCHRVVLEKFPELPECLSVRN